MSVSTSITTAQKIQATALFSDGSSPADTAWSIDNPAVARIDQLDALNVSVVALAVGTANLAVSGGGTSAMAVVTVIAAGGLTVSISFGAPQSQA